MDPRRLGNKEHVNFGQAALASTYPGLLCPWGSPFAAPSPRGTEHVPLGLLVALGLLGAQALCKRSAFFCMAQLMLQLA